jgi:fermentation-respiration switch protein FrsA (DUF1100 family)
MGGLTLVSLIIEFAKRKDGNTVLRCLRDDGSSTWQRSQNQQARFFPVHDLLHFAIEVELGFSNGFFGLIAAGWNIDETTGKSARGALPNEALEVEHLVSAFTAEWNSDAGWNATNFNEQTRAFADTKGLPPPRSLTDDDLARVRRRFTQLVAQWRDLPAGETLRLEFPPR